MNNLVTRPTDKITDEMVQLVVKLRVSIQGFDSDTATVRDIAKLSDDCMEFSEALDDLIF